MWVKNDDHIISRKSMSYGREGTESNRTVYTVETVYVFERGDFILMFMLRR